MSKAIQRIQKNAEQLMTQYRTAQQLLNEAVKGALPWAGPLAMNGAVPSLAQVERLATQLVAIVMASEPPEEVTAAEALRDVRW